MFRKILIANRGEIACRVIKTARKLGVKTVAVYSDADADTQHVKMADEAVHIGAAPPAESYLNIDRIVAAALQTGAQAVHPGYGFLSENPKFVRELTAAGLVFIGPSEAAIEAMGLKDAAKTAMQAAGVPVVPGYHGADQDPELLAKMADQIGYPVLIKAVAGGGGKGMRLVHDAAGFSNALKGAVAEGTSAFGNGNVLIEKYVSKPRHIEMQVFGDGVSAVHLFERDCSLQRRHQKVIEEAPAPGMTGEMRAAMGKAAVRAAMAIGYSGAGTVEFIADASEGLRADRFWFMEMNTRLQVEHPVTEAITGIDLVEWQLRVASGENLPLDQRDIHLNGHAFEARLYAEDVPKGFLPATGTLSHLRFPPTCRADTGVSAGDVISPWYDPMIAKIIVHGPTRSIALSQLSRALDDTKVAGTVTNLTFLRKLAAQPDFVDGNVDTGLIDRALDDLITVPDPTITEISVAAVAASGFASSKQPMLGFSLWSPLGKTIPLRHEDQILNVTVTATKNNIVDVGFGTQTIQLQRHGQDWYCDGQKAPMVHVDDATVTVLAQETHVFTLINPLDVQQSAHDQGGGVVAPMPGLVKDVFVAANDTVSAGDRLAILEAMKMEHTLVATRDGIIDQVLTAAGDQVEAGATLITFCKETKDG